MKRPDRLPEPALVRSVGVTITAVAAYLLGREVSIEWVETLTTLYALAAPLIAGALIRPAVTPVSTGRHARIEERCRMATLTMGGDDMQVQEWATLLTAVGAGGGITALVGGLFGKRTRKVDNLAKLEQIATGMVERVNADADRRVADLAKQLADLKTETQEAAARRHIAAAAHRLWDEQVAQKLHELGAEVSPPPSIEGVHL